MLNYVVKISVMSAEYLEYYTIILRGPFFSWTRCICMMIKSMKLKAKTWPQEMNIKLTCNVS